MRPAALLGALIGAVLGALLWAGVAAGTGLEIGWIAWGIGGAIGLGAALGGGRGVATGLVCAGLAVASIFAGKWLAVDMVVESELRELADMTATLEVYADFEFAASEFAELEGEDEHAWFMVMHGYTAAEYEEDVSEIEIAAFQAESVPALQAFHATRPGYDQWKQGVGDEMIRAWEAAGSNSEVVTEGLTAFDVLFFLLGIVTAFQFGVKGLPTPDRVPYRPRESSDDAPRVQPSPEQPAFPPSTAPVPRDEPAPAPAPETPPIRRTIPRLSRPPTARVGPHSDE